MEEKIFDELRVDNFIVSGNTMFCKIDSETMKHMAEKSNF
jgi:hypothetical protein